MILLSLVDKTGFDCLYALELRIFLVGEEVYVLNWSQDLLDFVGNVLCDSVESFCKDPEITVNSLVINFLDSV